MKHATAFLCLSSLALLVSPYFWCLSAGLVPVLIMEAVDSCRARE